MKIGYFYRPDPPAFVAFDQAAPDVKVEAPTLAAALAGLFRLANRPA